MCELHRVRNVPPLCRAVKDAPSGGCAGSAGLFADPAGCVSSGIWGLSNAVSVAFAELGAALLPLVILLGDLGGDDAYTDCENCYYCHVPLFVRSLGGEVRRVANKNRIRTTCID